MSGISIGDAAMHLLNRQVIDSFPPDGPDIRTATSMLDHLAGTKEEWRQAVAYLALQVSTYKRMSNQDASLALAQVEHIVGEFRARSAK